MENKISDLTQLIGDMDIYLLDQVLKGQFQPGMKILDAGSGDGRNGLFFLRNGFGVCASDADAFAVKAFRDQAVKAGIEVRESDFRTEFLENLSFPDRHFDAVICSAVLHFAKDEAHFEAMLGQLWRVLKYGGFIFCRLASDIGLEDKVKPLGGRRFVLPDGSQRFLVNEKMLLGYTEKLNGVLMEPIKTVNVQGTRCMTNWILSKVIG